MFLHAKKKRGPKWRYDGIASSRSTTEHDARKHDDGNRLVELKPDVRNMLAVEESRWNETWKS